MEIILESQIVLNLEYFSEVKFIGTMILDLTNIIQNDNGSNE
jgi:hypothetical protein